MIHVNMLHMRIVSLLLGTLLSLAGVLGIYLIISMWYSARPGALEILVCFFTLTVVGIATTYGGIHIMGAKSGSDLRTRVSEVLHWFILC